MSMFFLRDGDDSVPTRCMACDKPTGPLPCPEASKCEDAPKAPSVMEITKGPIFNAACDEYMTDHFRLFVIDKDICKVAKTAEAWEETAAQYARNADYYRGLVVKIGNMFGVKAYTADDGSISESVLCAKVPDLVAELMGGQHPKMCLGCGGHGRMLNGKPCVICSKGKKSHG